MNRILFLLVCTGSVLSTGVARAADSASLQFTVPAPNPVQAGETLNIQALAVNTGVDTWAAGSYYWVAEIYDLEENLVARTDQTSPPAAIASGDVVSISLPFRVPDTMVGRRLYRVFLVKDAQQLIASEFKPFQVLEKSIPEAPKSVDYRVEGNVTVSYKNSSANKWAQHAGATTINAVGKVKESSYLFNAYFLHEPGKFVDPFIVLLTYYAPWGTIYAGDISPTISELSLNGQGMRGAMLEQRRGMWEWSLLGGQTIESQSGTATTNGRFARSLYALKGAMNPHDAVKITVSYFLSSDETGSLGTDPNGANFRGPTLLSQKNSGVGIAFNWEPIDRMKILLDYQSNSFFADSAKSEVKDTSWKGAFKIDRSFYRASLSVQRAGSDFVSFGAPGTVGDRQTFNGSLSLYPTGWYSNSINITQYTDNLKNDPLKTTTTNRFVSIGNSFNLPSKTTLGLNASLNTAKGNPSITLDNQTQTIGVSVAQSLGRNSVSLSLQNSAFTDRNNLASDLDTNTIAFSSNFYLPRNFSSSLGITQSVTTDKTNGSKRSSLTISPSLARRLSPRWTGQWWATMTNSKNTSPTFPSDTKNTSLNSEYTWAQSKVSNLTIGLGYNMNKDGFSSANTFNEITVTSRYSYSF
ncbi:MAG: hypothetical protein COB53_10285 [Elusimicrobia bacterium]|nr:MAG: hypothetical protein COB53_10285 [Elusimicrobiota bacterium]